MDNLTKVEVKALHYMTRLVAGALCPWGEVAVDYVEVVYLGLDPIPSISRACARTAEGRFVITPSFMRVDEGFVLEKIYVFDGRSIAPTVQITICDLARRPDGTYALLADLKGTTLEYRFDSPPRFLINRIKRPRGAKRMIELAASDVDEAMRYAA